MCLFKNMELRVATILSLHHIYHIHLEIFWGYLAPHLFSKVVSQFCSPNRWTLFPTLKVRLFIQTSSTIQSHFWGRDNGWPKFLLLLGRDLSTLKNLEIYCSTVHTPLKGIGTLPLKCKLLDTSYYRVSQKKIGLLSSFEFLGLGGVFLGVKNNSKNFGNKKNIGLFSKILSKWAFFIRKMQKILQFYEFIAVLRMENIFRCYKNQYLRFKIWIENKSCSGQPGPQVFS